MCIGCLLTEKEKAALIEKLTKEVKAYAIRDQKLYILYDKPDGSIGYMEADKAREYGLRPLTFISHLVPDADVGIP